MNQTFFIAYLKEDFSSHGINDILHLPVTEETMNQVLLKWARHKSCEGKETNLNHWTVFAKQGLHPLHLTSFTVTNNYDADCVTIICNSQLCRAGSIARIFQRGRGHTVSKWRYSPDYHVIFTTSCRLFAYKRLTKWRGGSQAPQESLVMSLQRAQCVWRWTEETHWWQHWPLNWHTIFAMRHIKFLTF